MTSPREHADGRLEVALIQLCSTRSVEENVKTTSRLVEEAARSGATYVQTPEVTTLFEMDKARVRAAVHKEAGNPAIEAFARLARDLKIWLHIGSMAVKTDDADGRLANRAFLFAPDGRIAARYDKIHMFDVSLPNGETYRESSNYRPGAEAVVADVPWGKLGLTICYDMRFPYLYRALAHAGATLIAAPAAFTVPTGQAHWHTLLRARAIEAQVFILAAAQGGTHESGRSTYGHSIVISPWGEVLAEADGSTVGVIRASLDLSAVKTARERVPSLTHDREFKVVTAKAAKPVPA